MKHFFFKLDHTFYIQKEKVTIFKECYRWVFINIYKKTIDWALIFEFKNIKLQYLQSFIVLSTLNTFKLSAKVETYYQEKK